MKKKLMAITLIALMVITAMFTGCGQDSSSGDDKTLKIGLVQLVEHTSLDQIR